MRISLLLTWILIMVAPGCKKNNQSNFPNVQVEQYVYLSNPSNQALLNPGGWIYTDGGYRGIVVVRRFINGSNDDFAAFDRACPQHFSESCSQLEVSEDDVFAVCPCHGEKYLLFDGSPSENAREGMKQYGTTYSGGILHIFH